MVSEMIRVVGAASSFDRRLRVVGRVAVVDDRADHPRVAAAVGVLQDQRVETVLGVEDVAHLAVGGHHADAADAPFVREALLQQPVDVHGLMRAVEVTDADMHDADAELVAVVVRRVDRQPLPASNCSG